jgi:hypothetical protein
VTARNAAGLVSPASAVTIKLVPGKGN